MIRVHLKMTYHMHTDVLSNISNIDWTAATPLSLFPAKEREFYMTSGTDGWAKIPSGPQFPRSYRSSLCQHVRLTAMLAGCIPIPSVMCRNGLFIPKN